MTTIGIQTTMTMAYYSYITKEFYNIMPVKCYRALFLHSAISEKLQVFPVGGEGSAGDLASGTPASETLIAG